MTFAALLNILNADPMRKSISLFLTLLILVSSCKKKDEGSSTNSLRNQELQKILSDTKGATNASAMMMAVSRPSKNWNWAGAVGQANIGAAEDATSSHRFRVASVTKMFTAASILLLVQENKLSLEDKISLHLSPSLMTKIKEKIPTAENITVRNLLNHTSTLGEYTGTPEFNDLLFVQNAAPSREDVIDIGLNYSPVDSVIGHWHYSNTGYSLLSIIIEKVSAKPYRTFVKERILDPLQMQNTYFPNDAFMIKPYLTPYFTATPPATEQDNVAVLNCNWAMGTGDLVSSLADLQTFLQALMRGRIVSTQLLQMMQSDAVASAYTGLPNESYGLGLMMCADPDFVGHPGGLYGIYTNAFYFKSMDTYIITAVNTNGYDDKILEMMGKVLEWIKNNDQ